ncbi:flagellar motor protein MotB [Tuberibacillus sp. Marseille-P3662]|uniref:flagellar motor protein MotB n=1 Tax=Tuberibacillus sp. Marseille-P3662 TaxID=1965358 RepID=UPI000A1C9939|nr:flagellar motor protein MotB [Tuberibacillus sp. Marseille-P3662]
MHRRRRRKEESGEGGQDRWLVTYADMITLLLVFFIVLYSMSEVENQKFNSLLDSLQTAFKGDAVVTDSGTPPGSNQPIPTMPKHENDDDDKEEQKLDELYADLSKFIKENDLSSVISLRNLPKGVRVTFKEQILFDLGSAKLKDQADPILKAVSQIIKSVDNEVSIEGHTDNNPIVSSEKFASNWELSGARARNVLLRLADKGVARDRMRFVGYGEHSPIVPNDTKAHQQMNRRVNVVIIRKGDAAES